MQQSSSAYTYCIRGFAFMRYISARLTLALTLHQCCNNYYAGKYLFI